MDDLVAFLRARLDEDPGEVHDLDCNLSLSAGFHGPCDCGWPDRLLREVEAKRRILDAHYPVDPCDTHDASFETIPCDTLLLLALPDSDHPDYRSEWAVTS